MNSVEMTLAELPTAGRRFSDLAVVCAVIAHSQIVLPQIVPALTVRPWAARQLPAGFEDVDLAILDWIATEGRRAGRACFPFRSRSQLDSARPRALLLRARERRGGQADGAARKARRVEVAGRSHGLHIEHRGDAVGCGVRGHDLAGDLRQRAIGQNSLNTRPVSLPLSAGSSCMICATVRPRSALLAGAGSTNRDLKSGPPWP